MCLFGSVTPSVAQDRLDSFGIPDLLATLIRGDISSIPQDRNNYYAVSVTLSTLGYAQCFLREPQLSLYKLHLVEFMDRMLEKGGGGFGAATVLMHPRYRETLVLLRTSGCESDELQSIIWNGFRFGLGRTPWAGAYLLSERESSQHSLHPTYVDRYCFTDPSRGRGGGLYTPACEKLVSFVERGRSRRLRDGTVVPPVGEAVQLMTCVYGATTNPNAGGRFPRRTYTFWYERVPDDLSSYGVGAAGRADPFRGVYPIAVTECPEDSDAVAEIVSGRRSPQPSPSNPLVNRQGRDTTNAGPPISVEAVSGPTAEDNRLCYGGPWAETASDFTWTITPVRDSLRLARDDRAAEGMFGWDAGQSRWAGTLRWWNGHLFPGMTLVPASPDCEFHQLTITSPGLTAVMARSTNDVAPAPAAANLTTRSLTSLTQVQVTFVNSTSADVELFWVDFAGQEQPWGVIPAGTSIVQGSYATHVWRFKQGGRVLGNYTAESTPEQRWTIRP